MERLPVEPDALFTLRFTDRRLENQLAHFFYEADRGSMVVTDMLKKFRAYYYFVKRRQRHRKAFGIQPVRAVLVETTDEPRGRLMELATHPLVCGEAKQTGLFWFTISALFTDSSSFLRQPENILGPVWALPDHALRGLGDVENSG